MRYLDCMDLSDRKQFEKILKTNTQTNFFVENQYLKQNSLVLPGSAIFHLMFEGTKVQYLERVTQQQRTCDLEHEFYSKWDGCFQRVLADIGNLTNFNTKPTLETWYDIVKRVMRLKSKMQSKKAEGAANKISDNILQS